MNILCFFLEYIRKYGIISSFIFANEFNEHPGHNFDI